MKKIFSILLTVALILSLTSFGTSNVFAADITDHIEVYTTKTELPEGDNVIVSGYPYAVCITSMYPEDYPTLKVNGNVSLLCKGNIDSGSAAFVETEGGSASLFISGDVSSNGFKKSNGVWLYNSSKKENVELSAEIKGNVSAESDKNKDSNHAYGVYAKSEGAGHINAAFGKNIEAKAASIDGLYVSTDGNITVEGSITADSNEYDADGNIVNFGNYAIGANISPQDNGDVSVDIKGGITAIGSEAVGAWLYRRGSYDNRDINLSVGEGGINVKAFKKNLSLFNENNGIFIQNEYGGNFTADVMGDIRVSLEDPESNGAGVMILQQGVGMGYASTFYNNNVHLHGDIISDDAGLKVYLEKNVIDNIVVEGTIDAVNNGVLLNPQDNPVSNLNLTVWKIIPNADGEITRLYSNDDSNVPATELEQSINYIIKTEQPSAGGTFTVVKEDGTALDQVEGLDVAHIGDKIYVSPKLEEGYTLKSAYNIIGENKVELTKDIGGYYFIVPHEGGVNISIDVEEVPKPTPTPEPSATPNATPTPDGNGGQDKDKADDITKDIPFAENIPVEEKQTVIENTNTDKTDVAGSTMKYLGLKAAKVKKNSIKLTWKKVKGADGYIIYGNKCGKKMKYITTIKNGSTKSYTAKKLKKGKYYKYMVVAYKTTASGDKVITTSKSVHAATDGGKKGNPTSIKVKKTKVSLKKGKTAKIKASYKSKKKVATHIAKFRYESLDESIATVDKKGKIKGVGKGTTKILVYTQNGLSKTIKVTVK